MPNCPIRKLIGHYGRVHFYLRAHHHLSASCQERWPPANGIFRGMAPVFDGRVIHVEELRLTMFERHTVEAKTIPKK